MRNYHRKKSTRSSLYKFHPWQIIEREFEIEKNHHNEAIFALGNGYMGIRGILEEDYTGPPWTTTPGVYVNGIYGSEKIYYGEDAPDLPERTQTLLNLADWSVINLYLAEEKFDMLQGKVTNYSRTLDLREGVLRRSLIWESRKGRKIRLNITRLVSLVEPHIAAINYSVQPLNFSGRIIIETAINGAVCNYHHFRNRRQVDVVMSGFSGECGFILQHVPSTGFKISCAMINVLHRDDVQSYHRERRVEPDLVKDRYEINVRQGREVRLVKYISIYTSRDVQAESGVDLQAESVVNRCISKAKRGSETGFEQLMAAQKRFLAGYWDDVDVKIQGDPALQQGVRFNAFHLLQSTGTDGRTNVAAKGLTGEFYEGHYFWDTETYIIPFFIFNRPEIARKLLLYRYNTLDQARANARRMRLQGALYPWRTINGEEASGNYMGSTVQYHIDADIAYAIYQYVTATGDLDFLYDYGAEILIETARMWVSRGSYIPLKGNKFCLNEVCGPDEYKPGVNNNCYTNYMAKFNLEYALEALDLMKKEAPQKLKQLRQKVRLKEREIAEWKSAASRMYLPYHTELGIHPQDDSFLYKDPIDIDSIPEEEIPLVKNWHPLIIWRYQVIKQADVILLMLLLGDRFSLAQKKANYDFYEPKTTHDSSLSPAIYSIIASEIGYYRQAYDYFLQTARMDLDDFNGNTYQGVHTACMAGCWLALIKGFAGMRNYNGRLHLNPYLPDNWQKYEFKIKFRGHQLKVEVNADEVQYTLLTPGELQIYHQNQKLQLAGGKSKRVRL